MLLNESLLSFDEAAGLLPSNRAGKKVNFSTIWRWVKEGILTRNGEVIRLEACKVGKRWLTSKEAMERFTKALSDLPQVNHKKNLVEA